MKWNNILDLAKKHWRTLIELVTLVGILIAILQLNLQQEQYIAEQAQYQYDQSQKPKLTYSYSQVISKADQEKVEQAKQDLINRFYDDMIQVKSQSNDLNYSELTKRILPIRVTVPSNPLVLDFNLSNDGLATATEIRIVIKLDSQIADLMVDTIESYSIVEGGVGKTFATITIDRLVSKDTARIMLSAQQPDPTKLDTVVLEAPQRIDESSGETRFFKFASGDTLEIKTGQSGGFEILLTSLGPSNNVGIQINVPSGLSSGYFPSILYLPGQLPIIDIEVTSNEGRAENVPPTSIP